MSSNRQIFSDIYRRGLWGRDPADPFFSGGGSRDAHIVDPYVSVVSGFLKNFHIIETRKPDMIDLGCGDFSVGAKLRHFCRNYFACDVVPELIERNRSKFAPLDVEFRCLDAEHEWLPASDVIVIRQVLQHLSNKQIEAIIRKVETRCSYLIVTEHLPLTPAFTPNIDIPTGGWRVATGSGVVLTAPPFNLAPRLVADMLSVESGEGLIKTILYRL